MYENNLAYSYDHDEDFLVDLGPVKPAIVSCGTCCELCGGYHGDNSMCQMGWEE